MQLRRALFLSTASTTHHGASGMCVFEHYVLGLCVLLPACPGFDVHRTKFPLLERIMNAHHKSKLLLVITARDSRKRWARILFMFQNAVRRWPAHMGPSPAT